MMARGALFSDAARLADDALRMLVLSRLCLDEAGAVIPSETEEEIAELLDDVAAFADELLRAADDYGVGEVLRRAA